MEKTSKIFLILGERIAKKRERLQLSQKDLADLLGITQSSIAQIEKGQTNPSFGRLVIIAKALKVGVDELVSENSVTAPIKIDANADLKDNLEKIKDYLTSEIERIKPGKGRSSKTEIPLDILEAISELGKVQGGHEMLRAFSKSVLSKKK